MVKHEYKWGSSPDDSELVEQSRKNGMECDDEKCGGRPVVVGTRFTVSQFLAELADGRSVGEIAEDFDLDVSNLQSILRELAEFMSRNNP